MTTLFPAYLLLLMPSYYNISPAGFSRFILIIQQRELEECDFFFLFFSTEPLITRLYVYVVSFQVLKDLLIIQQADAKWLFPRVTIEPSSLAGVIFSLCTSKPKSFCYIVFMKKFCYLMFMIPFHLPFLVTKYDRFSNEQIQRYFPLYEQLLS